MRELDVEERHATTSVNTLELFYGACRSQEKRGNIEKAKSLLQRLDVLPFDLKSSEKAGESLADLAAHGRAGDYRDAMIASIAEVNDLTLVTGNRDHFSRFKGLELEVW